MPTYTTSSTTTSGQDLPPEDDYEYTVVDAAEKESKSSGNPMIELQNVIQYKGRSVRVYDYLVFTPNAFGKIDEFRVSSGEQLTQGEQFTLEAEDCVGRRGRCHVVIDTYNGKSRNKISEYLPPFIPARAKTAPKPGVSISIGGEAEPADIPFGPNRG